MSRRHARSEEVEAYDSLDGRELVPYQCVVRRSVWETVKSRFFEVFPLAKTAYRRANGGSSAPGVHEDVEPKYLAEEVQVKEELSSGSILLFTFLRECQGH